MGTITAALAAADPNRPALAAPERDGLSHGALLRQIEATRARLNVLGVGRGDAVAIVLPNGPEMAAAFVSIAAAAITAPLNPACRAEEFDFHLADLEARALVIQAGMESPARPVAARRGVPIIELVPQANGPAGAFTLEPQGVAPGAATGRRRRTISASSCTPQAPRRGRRWCRSPTATWWHPPAISAGCCG